MVVAGRGQNNVYLSDVELISLDGRPNCTKPMDYPQTIQGTVGTFYPDDGSEVLLVCGGVHGAYHSSCYSYSFANDSWNETGFSMMEKRVMASAILLPNQERGQIQSFI